MTRADFTTCGRNILPDPNRSPTTFMPAISGPSITSSGLLAALRAASVSASMYSLMPCTSACVSRSSTGASRQARSFSFDFGPPSPLYLPATSSSRSVASGRRLRITSSHSSRSSGSMSS